MELKLMSSLRYNRICMPADFLSFSFNSSSQRLLSSTDSTFRFLLEQWKEQLPQGYLLKEAFIDQPFEEDACYCHFNFVKDEAENTDSDINLKYQWFIGERTPSNFIEIHGATREVILFSCSI